MLCVGGAAAVSKEQYFVPALEHLRESRRSFDDAVSILFEEAGFHAEAFADHLFNKLCCVLHVWSSMNAGDLGFARTCASACPVYDFFDRATCSGVPVAITRPPLTPPSGPRSMIQSAVFMTSR